MDSCKEKIMLSQNFLLIIIEGIDKLLVPNWNDCSHYPSIVKFIFTGVLMKKKLFKIGVPILILVLLATLFITKYNYTKAATIDLQGTSDIIGVSININTGYNNELVVRIVTEEFMPPSQVFVDVLAKGTSIYSNKLEKEENDKFPDLGIYKDNFNSINELEKNYKDISVSVSFNEQSFLVPVTSIEIDERHRVGETLGLFITPI